MTRIPGPPLARTGEMKLDSEIEEISDGTF